MTTVREKVQLLEEKRYRQAEIQRDKGYAKVSKLFFDQQQQAAYPFANQISAPTTYESLQIPDIESQSEETRRVSAKHEKPVWRRQAVCRKHHE
jgi:hypothetical protein